MQFFFGFIDDFGKTCLRMLATQNGNVFGNDCVKKGFKSACNT